MRKLGSMLGRKTMLSFATALASLSLGAQAIAAPQFDGSFDVGRFSDNAKIVEGPDHNMWMPLEDGGNDVARIAPDGKVDKFEVEGVAAPTGIASGPDGRIWLTLNGAVTSFSPADPTKSSGETPIADIKAAASIVAGPNAELWVASENVLIHFSPANPAGFQKFKVEGLTPKDIDVAGGLLAIADTAGNRVVTVTPTGDQKDYPIGGQSQGVAGNAQGQIGFSQQSNMPTQVGVITPPAISATADVPGVDPFGVALGSDTAFWAARKGGAQRLTPGGESTFIGGLDEKYFVRQIGSGPNNTMWLTLLEPIEEEFKVARISGVEPPTKGPGTETGAGTVPETKLKKGPRKFKAKTRKAKVRFSFSSPDAGAKFECALVKKKKGKKKAAKPKFRPCRSPQVYRLKPGAYRFSVRAVLNGVADRSPATRGFRVVRARGRA